MVAYSYESLGSITGVNYDPLLNISPVSVSSSMRSKDHNKTQRFSFAATPTEPFTGVIHIQGSIEFANSGTWFDLVEMQIDDEGGTWSVEIDAELSLIRVVCKTGNYWSSAKSNSSAVIGANGDFTLDTIVVSVVSGDTMSVVANKINVTPGISAGNIVADVFNNALRITKRDGTNLLVADGTNSPLTGIGFAGLPLTAKPGSIKSIHMLR